MRPTIVKRRTGNGIVLAQKLCIGIFDVLNICTRILTICAEDVMY